MLRLLKKRLKFSLLNRSSSLCLTIAIILSPTVTLGDVGISCNKEALGGEGGLYRNLVQRYTTQINKSYVLVNLSKVDISTAIKKKNKVPSAEVVAAICAYYILTKEKYHFIGLHLTGKISTRDFRTFKDSLRGIESARKGSKKRGVILVSLNSGGGDVLASMKIGRLFAQYPNITTNIQPDKACASACVLILAAGDSKDILGKVGIHRMRFTDRITPNLSKLAYKKAYDTAMQKVRVYLQEMGVRASLVDDMMQYSSDEVHFLTKKEIRRYGLDQRNPYSFEQQKAKQIARCGEDWYALKLTLDKLALQRCSEFGSIVRYYNCLDSIYIPLYRKCR